MIRSLRFASLLLAAMIPLARADQRPLLTHAFNPLFTEHDRSETLRLLKLSERVRLSPEEARKLKLFIGKRAYGKKSARFEKGEFMDPRAKAFFGPLLEKLRSAGISLEEIDLTIAHTKAQAPRIIPPLDKRDPQKLFHLPTPPTIYAPQPDIKGYEARAKAILHGKPQVVLGDLHGAHHVLDSMLRDFQRRGIQPGSFIIGGDVLDQKMFSKAVMESRNGVMVEVSPKEQKMRYLVSQLQKFRQNFPEAEIIFIPGNHDLPRAKHLELPLDGVDELGKAELEKRGLLQRGLDGQYPRTITLALERGRLPENWQIPKGADLNKGPNNFLMLHSLFPDHLKIHDDAIYPDLAFAREMQIRLTEAIPGIKLPAFDFDQQVSLGHGVAGVHEPQNIGENLGRSISGIKARQTNIPPTIDTVFTFDQHTGVKVHAPDGRLFVAVPNIGGVNTPGQSRGFVVRDPDTKDVAFMRVNESGVVEISEVQFANYIKPVVHATNEDFFEHPAEHLAPARPAACSAFPAFGAPH